MAHPRMYDPDDSILARVREIALAFPGSDEKESHGRPAFYTRKVFCYYGGSARADGGWVEHEQAVVFLPDPAERPALEADGRFWVPAYLGPFGWMGLDLVPDSDWEEVAELVEESFRATAPRRLVAELDQKVG
ncbi:MAG: MmcQ/YjbR family DNA-binding protein [Actinomycetota bacterium]